MASEMDNREWLNEYKSLKKVDPNNPFTVPVGYFDELGERILAGIKLDEIKNTISADCFTVPENYFEELSGNIQSRIAIDEVLNTEHTGFTVPENYFEELNSNIQSRIAIEEALNTEHTGFIVPENYFEDLSSNIQSRIAVEEILNTEHTGFTVPENYFEELSNQVQSRVFVEEALANTANTFTVPQDYFNDLNKKILNKTATQEVVKRKNAVIRMISTTAFKYATAACFVLMIGAGIIFRPFNNGPSHDHTYLHEELSNVSVNDIQGYLEQNVDGNDTQHTVAVEGLQVNDADLQSALQDYTDNNQ